MKENTKQILKVSICTLVALILFVGVILMCIYFAFDNTNSSVARADEISSEELLFDDNRIIEMDKYSNYPSSNNCVYMNSSFDFTLLENPIRVLIEDLFAYDDIFIYRIARIRKMNSSDVFQYLYLAYWEGYCNLILSTDEYISQISNGDLLSYYDSYQDYYDNYVIEFSVWHLDFYISETEFSLGYVYHYENYFANDNLSVSVATINNPFVDYLNSLINTSPYFVEFSQNGVLYVPLSEDGDLTINPYITKIDYAHLVSYLENFDFSNYSPTYDDEEFYSLVDVYYGGRDWSFGFSLSSSDFGYLDDGEYYNLNRFMTLGPFVFSSYERIIGNYMNFRYNITDIKPLFYDIQHYLNYELEDGYCSDLGLLFSSSDGYLTSSYIYASYYYDFEIEDLDNQIEDLQNQVAHRDAIIEELREEIDYYESLDLNLSIIEVFNPSRIKSSTFVYDGVTYTSNSIVSTDDGWDVYSTTYNNQELPPNYGVGFSLFLPEYITNTKFYVYGDITGWYNYTYCSEPDEQGNQQCYQVSDMIATISVGYRIQNGNIVKVGTFTSNLPGAGGVDFFIDSPTNEIVFFVENCNLMEVDRDTQVIYYYFDTESIYNDGYENGKSQGLKIGREEGYYQGVAAANDYSFFSLFTSVFDAPITAIVGKWGDSDGDGVYQREGGMLNFYIPGLDINFAPFLLSLFTIAIIILVIRFVMARKS